MIDGMKTNMFFMLGVAVFLGVAARAEDEGKLEVHEWGTFTVISGSNGQPIQWYQPHEALSELPDFVYPRQAKSVGRKGGNSESLNLLGKSGAGRCISREVSLSAWRHRSSTSIQTNR